MAALSGRLPPSSTNVDLPLRQVDHGDANEFANDLICFTPVPTVILDAALNVRHVSNTYKTVSGTDCPEHLVGRHADSIFDPSNTLSAFASARKLVLTARDTKCIQQLQVTAAGVTWKIRATPIQRNDSLHCIQMEFLDISAEHQRQLELEEELHANETFKILVETVKDYAICMLRPTFVDANVIQLF